MDLNFTAEELAFRQDIRAWVAQNLPGDIAQKVRAYQRLTRDDHQRWARILGHKGWLGWGWPQEFGGPGWNAIQKHLFEEELAMACAPRVIPFGPVMVAPVIMAFGNAEQQKRFLPGIASGEVWWSQGYSEPGSGSDLQLPLLLVRLLPLRVQKWGQSILPAALPACPQSTVLQSRTFAED